MKKLSKIFAVIMVITMVAALALPTFAAETGSITINGAHEGYTYEIYKILDLESYDTTAGNYSYKVNEEWKAFFATADAKVYFSVNESGYATLVEGKDTASDTAAFAKLALAWAETNNIAPEKSTKNTGDYTTVDTGIKFTGLALGYYLVDSDLGTLCGLTTTNPNASLNAKNSPPTLDKQVKEDSTGQWGNSNTADIGQTVEFRVTINVHRGAQNFVFHDSMSEGLTFDSSSVKIVHEVPGDASTGTTSTDVPDEYYTVVTSPSGTHDNCKNVANCTHGSCTFEIQFTQAFCDHVSVNDKIIITYSAVVNEKAEIGPEKGNTNSARLTYGEGYCTGWDTTTTYSFELDIVKTDGQNTLIDGAKFELYGTDPTAEGATPIDLVKESDGSYRRATANDNEADIVTEIEVKNGIVTVSGFDNGTYYLKETQAPKGYNMLKDAVSFTLSDKDLHAVFNGDIYSVGSGIQIVNHSGTMLPETGGIGTMIFITTGSILVLSMGVLLVVKKRMSQVIFTK